MFISSYTTIYFFATFFYSNVYISVNTLFDSSYLFLGSEIGHPLNRYATGGMEGGRGRVGGSSEVSLGANIDERGIAPHVFVRTYTIYFMFLTFVLLFYL